MLSSKPPFHFQDRVSLHIQSGICVASLQYNSSCSETQSIYPPEGWTASSHSFIAARSLCNPEKNHLTSISSSIKGRMGAELLCRIVKGTSNWNTYEVVAKTDLGVVREKRKKEIKNRFYFPCIGSFLKHLRQETKNSLSLRIWALEGGEDLSRGYLFYPLVFWYLHVLKHT